MAAGGKGDKGGQGGGGAGKGAGKGGKGDGKGGEGGSRIFAYNSLPLDERGFPLMPAGGFRAGDGVEVQPGVWAWF